MNKIRWIAVMASLVAISVLFCSYRVWRRYEHLKPEMFAAAQSPDASWSVVVKKAWRASYVVVWAEAIDGEGNMIGAILMNRLEMWDEPEFCYSKVYCTNVAMHAARAGHDQSIAELVIPKSEFEKSAKTAQELIGAE